ncbi:MAG TPA: alanine racemase [Anaerolineaceae bacterium]|nr:alanine racemase [Anaerolineaceae bacterium]
MSLFTSIKKPTLLLDKQKARANIHRMRLKVNQQGVHFRPHFKTHQSAVIGEWFREEGVDCITVSSIDMAFYFARHGWQDITIAFPVNLRQIDEISMLASTIKLGLLVESRETIQFLSKNLAATSTNTWIKIDTGAHRTGLPWQQADAITQLAREIQSTPALHLCGLLTHAGNTYSATSPDEVCRRYGESVDCLLDVRQKLAATGLASLEISVGDTPGSSLCDFGEVDEVRPGNFVFYDSKQLQVGSCLWSDIAVAAACPVVAKHADRQQIVIYGGAIHLSSELWMIDNQPVYGLVALPDGKSWSEPLTGAAVVSLSQEHGLVKLAEKDFNRIQVGDLIFVLPAHSCLTVQAMREYLTLDGKVIGTLNSKS